ncbi:DUF4238 domain-containing protein [Archangium violaceum]|uniref:DUF4238 domain-containing protein n=1 Tax=Archangium violaceum TaxID=83451 RepID=UPI001950D12F|nr:DUF4238 domain-containing protein [Archangium violaceum]QRN99349.1 DUF4238 domain-containing protein [Archangium violaceum]
MPLTRDNHYVPRWYQKGFLEPGRSTFAYLDLKPPSRTLDDGRVITERRLFDAPTKRCFFQADLYSTFFGTSVNDEIERRLFGAIDTTGADAVRAFLGDDVAQWHEHFQTFFEYIDIQKIRTPKGLDWLKAQYPSLDQNELMMEMQRIRMLHFTIWTEGVREIVSAEDADVKFIVSDHPVTIYNHAVPPEAALCRYPHDPGIALKASQTIFPLNRDYCLILTNLEYAKNPSSPPLEKRTFARNFRQSMVRTDKFIRTRRLNGMEVARINHVIKARARRYVAAGRQEWLHPERTINIAWDRICETLLPPKDELWNYSGETFVRFEDGRVHYQDAFGRTEKERDALKKIPPKGELRPSAPCGCGSGHPYRACCKPRHISRRPSWTDLSIRERNIVLHRGIRSIVGLDRGKDWVAVRRELTDEQIKEVYFLYEALWPLETDLLRLLPKPDGRPRAVYTGTLHPQWIVGFAIGASLYFGELIVENPLTHPGTVAKNYSPIEHPKSFHLEFLKSVAFILNFMPLVDAGLINLIPNPCNFDFHLRRQVMHMADERSIGMRINIDSEPRVKEFVELNFKRDFLMWPRDAQIERLRELYPDIDAQRIEDTMREIERLKEEDPLTALQDGIFDGEGGQMRFMQACPNFEIAMYLAQATGATIVTDSVVRWREILRAAQPRIGAPPAPLRALATNIANATFLFPDDPMEIIKLAHRKSLDVYPGLIKDMLRYLGDVAERGSKPNWEEHLASRFAKEHESAQSALRKTGYGANAGRLSCVFAPTGIQDNTINRLLLMSSSEHHLPMVPMAFYIERVPDKE